MLDTSDASKAGSFIRTEAQHAGAHAASYRGVSYQATSAGEALGIVDRLAVLGTVTGLHNVIDTSLGGPSLVHAADYSKLLASAPSGALAHVYSNPSRPPAHGGERVRQRPSSARALARRAGLDGLLGLLGGTRTLNVSLVPAASSIGSTSTASPPATGDRRRRAGGLRRRRRPGARRTAGRILARRRPRQGRRHARGRRAGAAQPRLADHLARRLPPRAPRREESSGGFNIKGVLEGVLTPLSALSAPGAQTQHDFLSWMSSAGLFASGTGIVNLRGGIVLGSKDPSLSKAAVAKLGAALTKSGGSVAVDLDPRHRRRDLRAGQRPAGRTRHRQRPRLRWPDQVRDRPRRSLRQDALNPPSTLVQRRLHERRRERRSAKASSRA